MTASHQPAPMQPTAAPPAPTLEAVLARVLQAGTYLSMALIAIGTVLFLAGGGSPLDAGPPLDVGRIASDVLALRPAGFLWLGVLAVLATPMLRVLGALCVTSPCLARTRASLSRFRYRYNTRDTGRYKGGTRKPNACYINTFRRCRN